MSSFEQTILSVYGDEGKRWLANLPTLVKKISSIWELSHLKPVKGLSYNYVLSGFQHKKPVILKLNPDKLGANEEAHALRAFAGYGVIAVLEQMDNALLLERAIPGNSLKTYWPHKEDEAIKIVCDCIKQLHQAPIPKQGEFPHLHDWFSELYNDWPIPKIHLEKAKELTEVLLQTTSDVKLLHGDLHHENILQHGNHWLIIDPKGVIGDPAYELAAYIRNPMPTLLEVQDSLGELLNKRIQMGAVLLNLEEKRIRQWCYVQSILCWAWNVEDKLDTSYFAQLAEIFLSLLNKIIN